MSELERFPKLQLDFVESRVLGSLLEKETTTPDYYPMTQKAIQAACNQSSNRCPVTHLTVEEVEEAIQRLRKKEIFIQVHISGSRSPKYEHQLPEILDMTSSEKAVMTVLLLRGIQTTGEIKQRSERMHPFESVGQVEEIMKGFMEYPHGPLVQEIPVSEGRRVKTYGHLLGGEKRFEADTRLETTPLPNNDPDLAARVSALERKLAKICEQLGIEEEE